jgi:hypothetical protein
MCSSLKTMATPDLKRQWRELFDTEPPPYNRRFQRGKGRQSGEDYERAENENVVAHGCDVASYFVVRQVSGGFDRVGGRCRVGIPPTKKNSGVW